MLKLAIQEHLLPGDSDRARFEAARAFGFNGVELRADGLTERVPELAQALVAVPEIAVSSVHMGSRDGFLYPQRDVRERAYGDLRQAIADAVDLRAGGVTFVPHYGEALTPDLTPFMSPEELEAELFIWLLRTAEDLAYAIGAPLYVLPAPREETHFINRLEQAVAFRRKINDHPYVRVAACCATMRAEERDPADALRTGFPDLGIVYTALDHHDVCPILAACGYDGWLVVNGGMPDSAAVAALRAAWG